MVWGYIIDTGCRADCFSASVQTLLCVAQDRSVVTHESASAEITLVPPKCMGLWVKATVRYVADNFLRVPRYVSNATC